jgi:feruloyl esterase
MAVFSLPIIWGILVLVSQYAQAGSCSQARAVVGQCTTANFAGLLPSGATIVRADQVQSGGTYGQGTADLGYPTNATNLPELCAVTVKVTSSSTSSYTFGLFLPTTSAWNGRLHTVGNGGFVGGINWPDLGVGPHYGFASVSTDTGHNSASGTLLWAYEAPEVVLDWSSRAIHGSVTIAKTLVAGYYGKSITYSYYSGCSTGGRQGLKEIQLYQDTFDGALIGAPAWDQVGLMPWLTALGTWNLPATDPKAFSNVSQFQLLAATALKQCDGLDGLVDNIISSPELCKPDYTSITCGNAGVSATSCLTSQQIQTATKVHNDYLTTSGNLIYNGFEYGSENQWDVYQLYGNPANFDTQWEKYFLYNDPNWAWTEYNETVYHDAVRINPGNASAYDYDISDFRDNGGKVILYAGTADGVISTKSSETFYNRTAAAVGGDIDDFFRFFLVPGMQHCFLSPVNAPWMIGGWSQQAALGAYGTGYSVPGFVDKEHDALLALMNWVENGTAVDSIIATAWNISGSDIVVSRQRPLCPYPQKATYTSGNANLATSWHCA